MSGEHDAFHPALLVFDGEVHMSAGVVGEIRKLTPDPHILQQFVKLDRVFNVPGNFFHRKNLPVFVHCARPSCLPLLLRQTREPLCRFYGIF